MTSASPPITRRERIRAMTLAEIREHGYAQIAAGGPAALSLNGIAKAMGMSGPSMYRYFPSRDALLATLVTESYEELADTLAAAGQGGLPGIAHALRGWALDAPHRYRLVFGSTYGSGALDPDRVIPAAHRAMSVILAALAEFDGGEVDPRLARQLTAWGRKRTGEAPLAPGVLLLGITTWTRLHGVISLEIEGVFAQMEIDASRIYEAEIDRLSAR